ncbi:MAG TPA: cellulase family glycosylhydrolase [Ktedonobacteraceae bacterium]|nr:cellulase family glycosylhydrolase [Ktedonobacteraceae bacterium]
MLHSLKSACLSIFILAIVAIGIFKINSLQTAGANVASHKPLSHAATLAKRLVVVRTRPTAGYAFADGPYTVQGNAVLGVDGQRYLFHGIGRDSLEYNCWGDGHFDAQELAYMGSGTSTKTATYWGANTVRLPLSEGIWLNGQSSEACSAAQYQLLIKQTVDTLTALKLNVILDLQWSDAGGQSQQGGGAWAAPDADSVTFWQQVASFYKSYPDVLFELFNEPHPGTWTCWLSACTISNDTSYSQDCNCNKTLTYNSVGMQALVDAVRGMGATNLVLVAGMNWGFDLSQITNYPIQGANVLYDTHPYPYVEKQPSTWNAAFGTISKTYPVISAESGEYDCGTSFMGLLLAYFDTHKISWAGWAWVVQGSQCGYPLLVKDYHGTPVPGMGQLIYQHLRSYL